MKIIQAFVLISSTSIHGAHRVFRRIVPLTARERKPKDAQGQAITDKLVCFMLDRANRSNLPFQVGLC